VREAGFGLPATTAMRFAVSLEPQLIGSDIRLPFDGQSRPGRLDPGYPNFVYLFSGLGVKPACRSEQQRPRANDRLSVIRKHFPRHPNNVIDRFRDPDRAMIVKTFFSVEIFCTYCCENVS